MSVVHDRSGWIYAIGKDGTQCVKIGYTRRKISRRVQALGYQHRVALSLLATVHVSGHVSRVERAIHKRLAPARIEGEWFSVDISEAILQSLVNDALDEVVERVDGEHQEILRCQMLRNARKYRDKLHHLPKRKAETPLLTDIYLLTPEYALASAIVRQAWRDLRSSSRRDREQARQWWADTSAVRFWDDLLSLDGALLERVPAMNTGE